MARLGTDRPRVRRILRKTALHAPVLRLNDGPAAATGICSAAAQDYACRAARSRASAEHQPDHQRKQAGEHHPDREHQPLPESAASGLPHE